MAASLIPAWPSPATSDPAPAWYEQDVFRNALRRVVCVLNSQDPFTLCSRIKLSQSDGAIAVAFHKADLDARLIQYNIEAPDQYANSDQHHAEHHFYADVRFEKRGVARVAVFKVPRIFLDWGYQNLRRPEVDPLLAQDFASNQNDPTYVKQCATNYLVKNFWHNFVHNEIQGITHENYGLFRGIARESSDFQADHVANLLVLKSYGVKLVSLGRGGSDRTARIDAIFTRNRCNVLFAKRARHREVAPAANLDELWSELEWRFCRGVANRVSTNLLANNLAVPSIDVYLGGDVRSSATRGRRWRHGEVIVQVAGRRMASPAPVYVPDDEWRARRDSFEITVKRQSDIRRLRGAREQEVANWVKQEYRRELLGDRNLQQSIDLELKALGARIGVNLTG